MKHALPLFLTLLLLAGCGRRDTAGNAAPAAAATADQAILHVARGLENNNPSAAWHMLPERYQAELNDALREFAGAMDADLWTAGTSAFIKLTDVLEQQKSFLLSSPMTAMLGGREALDQDYDTSVKFLTILKNSDLMNLQALRQADLGRILASTGAELMHAADQLRSEGAGIAGMAAPAGELRKTFAGLNAELISQQGDRAVVKLTTPADGSEEVDFVRIEGKWIPADLAEEWTDMIRNLREGIAEIGTVDPSQKAQVLMMSTMVNGLLDQLLAAKTQEEFDAVLMGVVGMMMGGGL